MEADQVKIRTMSQATDDIKGEWHCWCEPRRWFRARTTQRSKRGLCHLSWALVRLASRQDRWSVQLAKTIGFLHHTGDRSEQGQWRV